MSKSIFFRRQINNFGDAGLAFSRFANWENDNTSITRVVQMYTNGASRIGIAVESDLISTVAVRLTLFADSISSNLYADFCPAKTGFPAPTALSIPTIPGTGEYGQIECTFETMYLQLETIGPGFATVNIMLVGWNGQ